LSSNHRPRGCRLSSGLLDTDASLDSAVDIRLIRPDPDARRPVAGHDLATSCESLIKTLKREEIYANEYRDLDHLRLEIEAFIEEYYTRWRLHSALGYLPRRSSSMVNGDSLLNYLL